MTVKVLNTRNRVEETAMTVAPPSVDTQKVLYLSHAQLAHTLVEHTLAYVALQPAE